MGARLDDFRFRDVKHSRMIWPKKTQVCRQASPLPAYRAVFAGERKECCRVDPSVANVSARKRGSLRRRTSPGLEEGASRSRRKRARPGSGHRHKSSCYRHFAHRRARRNRGTESPPYARLKGGRREDRRRSTRGDRNRRRNSSTAEGISGKPDPSPRLKSRSGN